MTFIKLADDYPEWWGGQGQRDASQLDRVTAEG